MNFRGIASELSNIRQWWFDQDLGGGRGEKEGFSKGQGKGTKRRQREGGNYENYVKLD